MNYTPTVVLIKNLSNNIYKEKTSINEKIVKVYRTITGRTPSTKEIDKLKNYLNEVSDLNSYEEKKAFNSLVVLVYNLDETTQKS